MNSADYSSLIIKEISSVSFNSNVKKIDGCLLLCVFAVQRLDNRYFMTYTYFVCILYTIKYNHKIIIRLTFYQGTPIVCRLSDRRYKKITVRLKFNLKILF